MKELELLTRYSNYVNHYCDYVFGIVIAPDPIICYQTRPDFEYWDINLNDINTDKFFIGKSGNKKDEIVMQLHKIYSDMEKVYKRNISSPFLKDVIPSQVLDPRPFIIINDVYYKTITIERYIYTVKDLIDKYITFLKAQIRYIQTQTLKDLIISIDFLPPIIIGLKVSNIIELKERDLLPNSSLSLDDLKKGKNIFVKGMPISEVIDHFKVLSVKKNKAGQVFLLDDAFISFIAKAFLGYDDLPRQRINYVNSEKGFVIKRFYEFYNLITTNYAESNRKQKCIDLMLNNFDNWNDKKDIDSFFKPNKTKENW